MSEVTILKSARDFRRWAGKDLDIRPTRWEGQGAAEYRRLLKSWLERVDALAPESYPCIAELGVGSFRYEEYDPIYIYPDDAGALLNCSNTYKGLTLEQLIEKYQETQRILRRKQAALTRMLDMFGPTDEEELDGWGPGEIEVIEQARAELPTT